MDDDDRDAILGAHAALVAEGVIEPLADDPRETRAWLDCEIASLVEGRFFSTLDPRAMTPELRARWEPRATADGEPLSSPHGQAFFRVAYWLLDRGERAGTIGLGTWYMGLGLVTVSSLYVWPSHRGRGVAGRALLRAREAVSARGGRGLRVPAYWTWQPAVRFYLGLGLWVDDWKHAIAFRWDPASPEHRIEVGEREASFAIVRKSSAVEPLIEATREGDRLALRELPALGALCAEERIFHAVDTFAVALALRGWPLLRADTSWNDRHRYADCGYPEGLAGKIELFEAYDRKCGFEVRAPRIPGIPYREYDEIG
jgi:GNAT superfamily N-acetyltransferase